MLALDMADMPVGFKNILSEGQISISKVSKNSIYITVLCVIQQSGSSLRKNFIAKEERQWANISVSVPCRLVLRKPKWKQSVWDRSYNRREKCRNFIKQLKQSVKTQGRQKRHGCFQGWKHPQTSHLASNAAVMDVWQTQKSQWQEEIFGTVEKERKWKKPKVWSIWGKCQKKAFKKLLPKLKVNPSIFQTEFHYGTTFY